LYSAFQLAGTAFTPAFAIAAIRSYNAVEALPISLFDIGDMHDVFAFVSDHRDTRIGMPLNLRGIGGFNRLVAGIYLSPASTFSLLDGSLAVWNDTVPFKGAVVSGVSPNPSLPQNSNTPTPNVTNANSFQCRIIV